MHAKSKLNNVETLISLALIDLEVSYEELKKLLEKKKSMKKLKKVLE